MQDVFVQVGERLGQPVYGWAAQWWELLDSFAAVAHAQNYPSRPIKIVVPYAPGGLPDTIARIVGAKLGDSRKVSSQHQSTKVAPSR